MKPITEKDFERVADWYGIHPTVRSNLYKSMFEEGKKMAIGFRVWYILQEREGNKDIYGKTPEQLFELYQQQKQ